MYLINHHKLGAAVRMMRSQRYGSRAPDNAGRSCSTEEDLGRKEK